jgi:uncharacterized protein (DUF1499 family)
LPDAASNRALIMNLVARIAVGLSLVAVLVPLGFLALGEDRFWRLFGEPDLGAVDIAAVQRRASPNDALACPAGFCAARADLTSPIYDVPASELRSGFSTVVASELKIEIVFRDDDAMTDRYVQRSARLGFPDTIVVRFLDLPDGRSTLAMYSRSRFGESDFGANRARIERWLAALAAALKSAEHSRTPMR